MKKLKILFDFLTKYYHKVTFEHWNSDSYKIKCYSRNGRIMKTLYLNKCMFK